MIFGTIYVHPSVHYFLTQVLWQSFDYPTDTLLPGMKIGINTKTGHRWSLTSWSSEGDPASGSYKLGMDPNNTNQLIIWWQGEIYWVSGLWQNSSFNLPHVLSNDVYYHFSYQSEEKQKYFKYFVYKDVISFQRLSLDTSGALWGMTTNNHPSVMGALGESMKSVLRAKGSQLEKASCCRVDSSSTKGINLL